MLTGRVPFEGDTPLCRRRQAEERAAARPPEAQPADPRGPQPSRPEVPGKVQGEALPERRRARGRAGEDREGASDHDAAPAHPQSRRPRVRSRSASPPKIIWIRRPSSSSPRSALIVWQFLPESRKHRSGRSLSSASRTRPGTGLSTTSREAIPNLLITSLEQSGHFRVTSWQG